MVSYPAKQETILMRNFVGHTDEVADTYAKCQISYQVGIVTDQ